MHNPAVIKSFSYLAQALLALHRPQEAHDVAVTAYRRSLDAKSAQTESLSRTVLRAKQQLWEARETARLRGMDETLNSVEMLIEAELGRSMEELRGRLAAGEIGDVGFGEDEDALRKDAERKVQGVREAFRIASKGEVQERVSFDPLFLWLY